MSDTPKQPNEGNAWVIPLTKHGALIKGKTYQPTPDPQGKPLVVTNNIASSLLTANRIEPFTFHNFIVKTPDPWVDENGDPRQDSPPEDYGSDLITIQDEEKLAYTFYVDSVSWDDSALWRSDSTEEEKQACLDARDTSGDGTKENPWKNLSYVLDILECLLDRSCCYFFRVVVSGTVDYTVTPYSTRLYCNNRVVFDFQTSINIKRKTGKIYARNGGVYNIDNAYFYNCTISIDVYGIDAYGIDVYGVYDADHSYFYNCTISAYAHVGAFGVCNSDYSYFYNCTISADATTYAAGVYDADHSYFYNCTISADSGGTASGTASSDFYSYFYNCTISAYASADASAYAHGISGGDSCFYTCIISAYAHAGADADATAHGISGGDSYFYNCTISADASADAGADASANAQGISTSDDSYFYNCTISAYAYAGSHEVFAYGVYNHATYYSHHSYFYNCTISADVGANASADGVEIFAYGVCNSDYSYFYNCTISAYAGADAGSDRGLAYASAYGVYNADDSYFYNCTISAYAYACAYADFYPSAHSYAYGVEDTYPADYSYFYNCTISADADADAGAEPGHLYISACPSFILLDPSNNVIGSCECTRYSAWGGTSIVIRCRDLCEQCAY